MLVELRIENLAVVESLRVEFADGFTVLTGETGAGKSILIDALLLALGERADTSAIRSGFDRAQVQAVFVVAPDSTAAAWLAQQEIELDDGLCLLRRTLHRERASRCSVNGGVVTAASLRELGRHLVDIHGQHAHQSLFQPGAQRQLLDQFAGVAPRSAELAALHARWSDHSAQLADIDARAQSRADRLELVDYQLGELQSLAPEPQEWEQIDAELRKRSNARSLAETVDLVTQALRGEEGSLLDQLGRLTGYLEAASRTDPSLAETQDLLASAAVHAAEAASALSRYLDGLDFDEQRTRFLEERVARFHQIARKHQTDPAELPRLTEELALERDTLLAQQLGRSDLERVLSETRTAYDELAGAISKARREAAPRLAAAATELVQQLGMPDAQLVVETVSEADGAPTRHGWDAVSLLFSANPFPGHQAALEWRREEHGGNWYYSPELDMEGWLCPAMFKYFDEAPEKIYARFKPKVT